MSGRTDDPVDPRGLIEESYRMEGLGPAECRTIFLDWALGVPEGEDIRPLVETLLARHGGEADHPMTAVLRDGLAATDTKGRRGGAMGRRRAED